MTRPRRRLWLIALGAAALVGAGAWFLAGGGGPRLAKDEVAPAREFVRILHALQQVERELESRSDDPAPLLRMRRAFYRAHLRKSAFADIPPGELEQALAAADRGEFSKEGVTARGVYGTDDRIDHEELARQLDGEEDPHEKEFLRAALDVSRSVGAWMLRFTLKDEKRVVATTLGEFWGLCEGERFASQPKASLGTAFLVGPDTVVTAAHVLDIEPLSDLRLVFDYQIRDGKPPKQVGEVYRIQRVIERGDGRNYDWAVVMLDRPVKDRPPLTVATHSDSESVRRNDDIYMWGHSAGTPKKFMRGTVRKNSNRSNSIHVILDAFGGDSGSPVLNGDHEVVGVLYGGSEDFAVSRSQGGCKVAAQVTSRRKFEYVTNAECFRHHTK